MIRTTNPTTVGNIRATALCVGAASAVLTTDQCLAAYRASRAVEAIRADEQGALLMCQVWLPYVPCIGLPYHGPVPSPDTVDCRACTCQRQHPDSPQPCPWCDAPETGTAMGFHEVVQDVEDEFVELTRGHHLCPKCRYRAVKHILTPGPDPSVFRKCTHTGCGYEEL